MNTNHHDEFFPDVESPQTEQLAVLKRVVPKSEFLMYANTLTTSLLESESSLEAFVRIRNVIEILDTALGQIKERAIVDVTDSSCEIFGAKVQLKQLPRKYEYTDRMLNEIEAEKQMIEAKLKARKKFLESLPMQVKDESGELITPARLISGGVTIQVSF